MTTVFDLHSVVAGTEDIEIYEDGNNSSIYAGLYGACPILFATRELLSISAYNNTLEIIVK